MDFLFGKTKSLAETSVGKESDYQHNQVICCRKTASELPNVCKSTPDARKVPFVIGTNSVHR